MNTRPRQDLGSFFYFFRLLRSLFSYEILDFTNKQAIVSKVSFFRCGVLWGLRQKKTVPGVLSSRQATISSSLNTNLILILLRTFP